MRCVFGKGLLLLALGCAGVASATVAPPDELGGADASALRLDDQALLILERGDTREVRFDAETATAKLPSGAVRYRRFMLQDDGEAVRISIRIPVVKHDAEPRFTVFSPQLVLLDRRGQIRRIVPLDRLQLDIRPFRATRLRECVVVDKLHSFLVASDPGRLGELYQFHAKRNTGGHPDHGFFRNNAPMKVFLTYADVGPIEVKVTDAPAAGSACRRVPD